MDSTRWRNMLSQHAAEGGNENSSLEWVLKQEPGLNWGSVELWDARINAEDLVPSSTSFSFFEICLFTYLYYFRTKNQSYFHYQPWSQAGTTALHLGKCKFGKRSRQALKFHLPSYPCCPCLGWQWASSHYPGCTQVQNENLLTWWPAFSTFPLG